MSDVHTSHRIEDGEQVTTRRVTVTDAAGQEYHYEFERTQDGHEYVGEGEPSDVAVATLQEWVEENIDG